MSNRKVIIIAGPNGAGKTTFAQSFLPVEANVPRFVNADLIAAGLAPFAPETAAMRAGRLMLEEIELSARRGESFAFETTLAGLGYLWRIAHWRAAGYRVSLFFLSLPNVETAIARVALRVQQGGHDIPEPVIRRRFAAGWEISIGVTNWRSMIGCCMTIPAPSRCRWNGAKTDETARYFRREEPRSARLARRYATRGGIGARNGDPDRHGHRRRARRQAGAHPGRAIARTGHCVPDLTCRWPLEKQKEGKKRMREYGSVSIPQEAFIAALRMGEE